MANSRVWRAVAAGVALAGITAAASDSAHAGAIDKVFVCKYVGTPGVDEILQTGQNPISVNVNAIPGNATPGTFFQDSQGRSFVLAFDTGQEEPDVSECPPPQGPGTTTTGPTTTAGPTTMGGPTTTEHGVPTTGGGVPTSTLPATGGANANVIGAAVLLVLAGGIGLAAARRRTASDRPL